MNLIEPPKSKVFSWVAKHRKGVADYFKAVFQLSKLKAILSYQGKNYPTVVTYNGRNAELALSLDFIPATGAAPCPINELYGTATLAAAGNVARVADALVVSFSGSDITNLSASRVKNGLTISNSGAPGLATDVVFGMTLLAGDITAAYSVVFDATCSFDLLLTLYDVDFVSADTASASYSGVASASGSLVVTAASAGNYRLQLSCQQVPGPGSPTGATFTSTVTATGAKVGDVIAVWNDATNTGIVAATP